MSARSTTIAATTGSASSSVSKSDVDNAKTIAIIGVIVGALGLIAGAVAIVLARRRTASSALRYDRHRGHADRQSCARRRPLLLHRTSRHADENLACCAVVETKAPFDVLLRVAVRVTVPVHGACRAERPLDVLHEFPLDLLRECRIGEIRLRTQARRPAPVRGPRRDPSVSSTSLGARDGRASQLPSGQIGRCGAPFVPAHRRALRWRPAGWVGCLLQAQPSGHQLRNVEARRPSSWGPSGSAVVT